jgi:hypothetical protein
MSIHTELESEIQELSDKIQTLLSGVPLVEQDLLTSIGKIRNLADELTTRNAELSEALKTIQPEKEALTMALIKANIWRNIYFKKLQLLCNPGSEIGEVNQVFLESSEELQDFIEETLTTSNTNLEETQ